MSDEILIDEEKEMTPEELVDNMTLFSDDLMSKVFDENIEATELLLRIILGRPVKVLRVKGQYEIRNPRHFKETEEGREIMCKEVERYGDRREVKANLNAVQKLMSEMKMTLDQAITFLGLDSEQSAIIAKQIQK